MSTDRANEIKKPAPLVVGIGELLWDQAPSGRHWGGAPANFACHAGQLGAEAWVVSAVGDDDDGAALTDAARAHGVRPCVARVAGHPTGYVDVRLDAADAPSFHIPADSAWDHLPWTEELKQLAARTDAACFGSLAQRNDTASASIRRFLDAMPSSSTRIFDMNLRAPYADPRIISESLEYADVLKVNEDEWPRLASWLDLDGGFYAAGRALCARFELRCVIQTLGARGSQAVCETGEWDAEAVSVAAIDTVGAGDAFTATCCLGLLRGADAARMLRAAAQVASFVCTRPGGTPRLPEELIARVHREMGGDH